MTSPFLTTNTIYINDHFEGYNGEEHCYIMHLEIINMQKPYCEDIPFTITFTDLGISFDGTIVANRRCCPEVEGGPIGGDPIPTPEEEEAMRLSMYANNDDESMLILGEVPQYRKLIRESREKGIPVRYTLLDKSGGMIDYHKYSDKLRLELPRAYKTTKQLNNNYSVHLLVSDSYIQVPFPELEEGNSDIDYEMMFGSDTVSDVVIFPNPTQGEVTIKLKDELLIESLALFDTEGKQYLNKVIMNNQTTLNLANYPDGLYFVEIIDTKGNILKEKIVLSN